MAKKKASSSSPKKTAKSGAASGKKPAAAKSAARKEPAAKSKAGAKGLSGFDVKVISKDGDIVVDGELSSFVDRVVALKGGYSKKLAKGHTLLRRCELADLKEGQQILLVDQWGCGGTFMRRGYFGKVLSETSICFKTNQADQYEVTSLGHLAQGAYLVLS